MPAPTNYDVIVIGGGVNGTAALRELARAGYRVLLAEADDLAAGASGRSSRMVHCGLRYLETPRPVQDAIRHPVRFARALGMARDSMQARADLAADDSVATRPIELAFPVWNDGPFPRWQLNAGLRLLAAMAPRGPALDRASMGRQAALAHPIGRHLRDPDRLRGMVAFREYLLAAPERLCVDNALAARADGAMLRLGCQARLGDRLPDGRHVVHLADAHGQDEVTAACVLNMAGAAADGVGRFSRRLIRGTKGAHIVIRLPEGFAGRGIATVHRGGHPFYGLPLGDDLFYFGPTETPYDGHPTQVQADAEDLAFLLAEANHLLPGLGLTVHDVEYCWAGVRPLTHDPARPMGARERVLHDLGDNVLAMTAGPVMSHRSGGERVLAEVRARIGAPSRRHVESAPQVQDTDSVIRAVRDEHATDLWGVLATRTGTVWRGTVTPHQAAQTAERIAPLLGWDPVAQAAETDRFLQRQHDTFMVPGADGRQSHPPPA